MNNYKLYKSKKETGLPFDIQVDKNFYNFRAVYPNKMMGQLDTASIINIHLLIELKKKGIK